MLGEKINLLLMTLLYSPEQEQILSVRVGESPLHAAPSCLEIFSHSEEVNHESWTI